MKHTNLHSKYQELENQERRELTKAIKAHGGCYTFPQSAMPIIMCSSKHADTNTDHAITHLIVNKFGAIEIYGFDINAGGEDELIEYVEFGHLGYVIDQIQPTETVDDVSEIINQ